MTMTEKYNPTYLVSNLDQKERLAELKPQIERNVEEIKEEKTGSRTLEAKYKEFLYFMARYEASVIDQKAVKDLASFIKDHDRTEMNLEMDRRLDIALEEKSKEEQGAAIAERFKKIIDFKELKLPNNLTLAGNLDMDYGIPLRAKYFGSGVSSKYITTWDQLLYALDAARPETDREVQEIIDGKPVSETAPFSGIYMARTDKAFALRMIMDEYKPTN